ncbi:MAG: extracellular solute-binding protein [Ruminococcus sp.]|nr:extracellular solute-binding protein [Ruminococcus sp.]
MKKLFALSMSFAMFIAAVSCSSKVSSSSGNTSISEPVITQTMYKEERVSLPDGVNMPNAIHVTPNGGINILYQDNYGKLRAADFTKELSFSGSCPVSVPENTELNLIDFNPDGTATAFLMYCEDPQKIIDGTADGSDISFIIAEYDTDLNLVEQKNVTGIDNYISYGSTFFNSFSKAGEDYILCSSNNVLKIDSSGKVTAHTDADFNTYYIAARNGEVIYFNNHSGYGYADKETLDPPSSPTPFEMSAPIQRPPYPGDDVYLCYIILKDGYYGLTQSCKLQKIIDFPSSIIDAGNVYGIAPFDKGQYLLASSDSGGAFLSILTVRPDDYVDQRKTVIVGMHNIVNQQDYELANEFARFNDDYKVEYREYAWDSDDLKTDILTGDAPDMFIGRADDVYRYTNLGAFIGLDELHEKYGGLSRDDLLPNIAESFTYKDDIFGIPTDFKLSRVFIADKNLIGRDKASWNFDQFLEIYNSMPEDMYLSTQYSYILDPSSLFWTMQFQDEYIDFDNNSCDFDNEGFIRKLEFCKDARLIPPLGDSFYENSTPEEQSAVMEENSFMLKNKKAMISNLYLANLNDFVREIAQYHYSIDDVAILPVPSDKGANSLGVNNGFYSIVRNGKCTEGAWQYLNYIMDDDRLTAQLFRMELPVTKVSYEYWMNKWRDHLAQTKENTMNGNGYEITYSTVISDESFEYINELLTTATTSLSGMNDELQKIITEETDRYFNDECSAEECADMLQNRVSIFLSERS